MSKRKPNLSRKPTMNIKISAIKNFQINTSWIQNECEWTISLNGDKSTIAKQMNLNWDWSEWSPH